jgi:hypothetical protein
LGGKEEILGRWVEHFSELLNEAATNGENVAETDEIGEPVTNDDQPSPSLEEVREAIGRLKNWKAAGSDEMPPELLKYGGEELNSAIHKLIVEVWKQERMPEEWNEAIIIPILKKGNAMDCNNYRGISLLQVAYKVLSSIIATRLTVLADERVGEYQCGFRRNRSTIDHIFTIRATLEKCWEHNIDIHQLFIDFKQAYDSIDRRKLRETLRSFEIPEKLIRMIQLTLKQTTCRVRIQGDISRSFLVLRGLRQGDCLSTILFNLILERVFRETRRANVRNEGSVLDRGNQILAFADDVDIIGRTTVDVKEAFVPLEEAAKNLGLKINEDKTKYMWVTRRKARKQQNLTVGDYNFEVVRSFKYLGSTINDENDISEEIKLRTTLGNRCCFALHKVLRSKSLSWNTKVTVYKTIIRPIVMYGCETWTLTEKHEKTLNTWERKILRKIFGPINDQGAWRKRYNHELYNLYKGPDTVASIKSQRLRWAGHVARMDDERFPKKALTKKLDQKKAPGRPRRRWEECVKDDVVKTGCREDWKKKARSRPEWKLIVEKTKALKGPR